MSQISQEIAAAGSEKAAIQVATKYHLCNKDGKLDDDHFKEVKLSDGDSAYVQVIGFVHDDKSDGSGKAGITFAFRASVEGKLVAHAMNKKNTNAGGWEASDMRTWMNTELISELPSELQAAIVPVDKLTNNVGDTKSTKSVTATSDKLWLFSLTEFCGEIDWWDDSDAYYNKVMNAEGSQYQLFKDVPVDSYSEKNEILARNGKHSTTTSGYWMRSPFLETSDMFSHVDYLGDPGHGGYAKDSRGVVPGFCI